MKIAITGFPGQLASGLHAHLKLLPGYDVDFYSSESWDLTNGERTSQVIGENNYDYIINCAAYTQVDKAENEPDLAYAVNTQAIKDMVRAIADGQTHIIHISTDYVYHPEEPKVLKESDPADPRSVYATTKWQGEQILQQSSVRYTVIRTSWVYSPVGHNFVKTMHRLLQEKDVLRVVHDQWGCPTSAWELAEVIIAGIVNNTWRSKPRLTYNYSEKGWTSWYEMTCFIRDYLSSSCQVIPIATCEYPTAAARPLYSALSCQRIDQLGLKSRLHWKIAMLDCLERLSSTN